MQLSPLRHKLTLHWLIYASIKHCQWGALRRHHIQAIIDMLSDADKAPATINTYLAALKGVALEAWAMKLMDTESYQHIRQVKSVRGSRLPKGRALTGHEIRALFRCCEKDHSSKGLRDAAILSVLLGCGLRRSEIVALNYEHIQFRDQAFIVRGKGNKERISYMPQDGALFTRIRRFDDVTDERITDQAIYYILETRQQESGIDKFAPHDLRRTFASAMLDNGEDIVTVKDAMGHASIMTTQRYDRRGDDRLRKAARHLRF